MYGNYKPVPPQQHLVHHHARRSNAYDFFNLLTGAQWLTTVESLLPVHRERLFPPTETLSMFMAQALSPDRSCQQAVNTAAVKRLTGGLTPCSTHTGSYCKARLRLPTEMVSTLTRHTGRWIAAQAPATWHWMNRPVRLVDGTTVTLPDTPENQADYPQSRNQKPGLGFPLCRIVGLICLGSGAVLNAAFSRYSGKGSDEQSLLRSMLDTLERDDLLLNVTNGVRHEWHSFKRQIDNFSTAMTLFARRPSTRHNPCGCSPAVVGEAGMGVSSQRASPPSRPSPVAGGRSQFILTHCIEWPSAAMFTLK